MSALTRRPATPDDEPFLRRVFASTRERELSLLPFDESGKQAFLRMQYDAQSQAYRAQYPDSTPELLLLDDQPAGRLWLSRAPDELHLIDIALLPEYRGQGHGTALLTELLHEAADARLPFRLQVEITNPAQRLYHRLGLAPIRQDGMHLLMEWSPAV